MGASLVMKRSESGIRVIAAFFAVLLGFGLKQLLDTEARLQPSSATGSCCSSTLFRWRRCGFCTGPSGTSDGALSGSGRIGCPRRAGILHC